MILNFLLIKCLDVLYVCVRHAHARTHTHTTYQLYYYNIEYDLSMVLSNSLSIIYLVVNVILVYKFCTLVFPNRYLMHTYRSTMASLINNYQIIN